MYVAWTIDDNKLNESPQDEKQKSATALLWRELQKHDFAKLMGFTCFQNSWSGQPLPHCTDSAPRANLRRVLLALG